VHTDPERNVVQSHAVQPVSRKQFLRDVEDLLDHLGALIGLPRSPLAFHVFGHATLLPVETFGGQAAAEAWDFVRLLSLPNLDPRGFGPLR
jgi:hypothetical protein